MRAFVVIGPRTTAVLDVEPPAASPGQVARPLVAATVGLDRVGEVLAGWRPSGAGAGPKILVDPHA